MVVVAGCPHRSAPAVRWLEGLAALLCCGVAGCAVAGVSFQTLGVPTVTAQAGHAAIVFGWELEQREGWAITQVQVDGQPRQEWDAASQRPAVLELEPGVRSLRLVAEHRTSSGGPAGPVRRRQRLAPVALDLSSGDELTCSVRIAGTSRRRPRVECSRGQGRTGERAPRSTDLLENPYGAAGDERSAQAQPPQAQPPQAQPPQITLWTGPGDDLLRSPYRDGELLIDRIGRIEERLDRIEQTLRQLLEAWAASQATAPPAP